MVKAYNQKVTRANRATGKKRRRLNRELKLENKAINRINRKIDQFKGKGPVLRAYLKVRGQKRGPTPYGETSAAESFAESFALYRVDPKALKRVFPKVYQWFKRNEHLTVIKKNL